MLMKYFSDFMQVFLQVIFEKKIYYIGFYIASGTVK